MTSIAPTPGFSGQMHRNLQLEPIFGANYKSPAGSVEREDEKNADRAQMKAGFGIGGGLLAVGTGLAVATKMKGLGKVGGGLAALTGAVGLYLAGTAVAGWINLKDDAGKGGKTLPKPPAPGGPKGPDKTDPTDPKGPTTYSHTVVRGDTLTDIANCNDVSVENLYTYNQDLIGDNGNRIMPGMKLIIPPKDYQGPGAQFAPTGPRSLPQNQCVAPIPGSALEPCV